VGELKGKFRNESEKAQKERGGEGRHSPLSVVRGSVGDAPERLKGTRMELGCSVWSVTKERKVFGGVFGGVGGSVRP